MKSVYAMAALILAVAALPSCASMEPVAASTSSSTVQPGSFQARMNGELRAYGTVSSKPR